MGSGKTNPLRHVTREVLEPLWLRRDISTERIAEVLGVSRQAVSLKAKRLGLPSRAGNQASRQNVDAATFERLWRAGVCTTDIAKAFGYCNRTAVSHRARMMGLPRRRRGAGPGGWAGTIRAAEFREIELARRMQGAAET